MTITEVIVGRCLDSAVPVLHRRTALCEPASESALNRPLADTKTHSQTPPAACGSQLREPFTCASGPEHTVTHIFPLIPCRCQTKPAPVADLLCSSSRRPGIRAVATCQSVHMSQLHPSVLERCFHREAALGDKLLPNSRLSLPNTPCASFTLLQNPAQGERLRPEAGELKERAQSELRRV